MPSVSKNDVAGLVYSLVTSYPELEVAEMTVQAHHNYRESQQLKEFQRGTTH